MRMKLMVVVAVAVGMMAPVDSAFAETTVRGGDAAQSVSKSVPKGWMEDFEAARRQAAKEGKLILMNFSGSDWCGWCKKMDSEVFSQERFVKEASKKYVLVMIDSPKDSSILSGWGGGGEAFGISAGWPEWIQEISERFDKGRKVACKRAGCQAA